jgi:hypothetical protein
MHGSWSDWASRCRLLAVARANLIQVLAVLGQAAAAPFPGQLRAITDLQTTYGKAGRLTVEGVLAYEHEAERTMRTLENILTAFLPHVRAAGVPLNPLLLASGTSEKVMGMPGAARANLAWHVVHACLLVGQEGHDGCPNAPDPLLRRCCCCCMTSRPARLQDLSELCAAVPRGGGGVRVWNTDTPWPQMAAKLNVRQPGRAWHAAWDVLCLSVMRHALCMLPAPCSLLPSSGTIAGGSAGEECHCVHHASVRAGAG